MWYFPVEKDNWGHLSYYCGETEISAGKFLVKWPDGAVQHIDIYLRDIVNVVYDSGHRENVDTKEAFITFTYFGQTFKPRLIDCNLSIYIPDDLSGIEDSK